MLMAFSLDLVDVDRAVHPNVDMQLKFTVAESPYGRPADRFLAAKQFCRINPQKKTQTLQVGNCLDYCLCSAN